MPQQGLCEYGPILWPSFFRLVFRSAFEHFSPLPGDGAIAQLGERDNGIVEVRGSIPLGSTSLRKRSERRLPRRSSDVVLLAMT